MRSRHLGTSGLATLLVWAVTSCTATGTGEVASGSERVDRAGSAAPAAATGAPTGAPKTNDAGKRVRSGCTANASYEICFSSPGTKGGSDPAVVHHLIQLFDRAGAGDSLRIAMFRWDIPATTKALVAAQQRGAHVEIVADEDMTTKPAGQQVMAQIEAGDPAPGNVVVCQGACLPWRGTGPAPPSQNVNHLKLLLADIGGVRSVSTSSSNFEGRQYSQYNSMARVSDPRFYAFGLQYFERLKRQSLTVNGVTWTDKDKAYPGPPSAMVYPRKGDLVVDTLKSVRCAKGMRTVDIMIAVVQRYDVRAQIGRLVKDGCKVRVITTRDLIENWLQSPFTLPDGRTVDLNNNVVRTIITHDKVYAIHARIHGKERYLVLTGTSNTTCGGLLYNDELMMRLDGKWAFKTFVTHVTDAFRHAHQSRESVIPVQARCH